MRASFLYLVSAAKRRPLVTALTVLLIVVRATLPFVVERVIETSAAESLRISIGVGDVDFGLLRGVLTAEDVRVGPPNAVRDEDGRLQREHADIVWDRVAINLRWLALLGGHVELSAVTLEGPAVRVVRDAAGAINLVDLFASETAAEEAGDQPAEQGAVGPPISVKVLRLRRGRLGFEDRSVEQGASLVLEIDALDVDGFAWPLPSQGEEVRLLLRSVLDGGRLELRAAASEHDDGALAVSASLDAKNLRLVGVRAYTGALGWADLRGLLDAKLDLDLLGERRQQVSGSLSLHHAAVALPQRETVPLWFDELALRGADIDLVARTFHLDGLRLDGASVLADPRHGPILPIILARADETGDEESAALEEAAERSEGSGAEFAERNADVASQSSSRTAGAAEGPREDSPRDVSSNADTAWSWSVDAVSIDDSVVHVVTAADPLQLAITARIDGLASDEGTIAPATLSMSEREGSVDLEGRVRLAPPGAGVRLRWRSLDLARLASAVPVDGASMLRGGSSDGELAISAGLTASPADDGNMDAVDLAVQGKLSVSELAIAMRDGFESDVAWKRLDIGLDDLTVPDALGRGVGARADAPVSVRIADLLVKAPNVRLVVEAATDGRPGAGETEPVGDADVSSTVNEEAGVVDVPVDGDAGVSKPFELTIERLDVRDARVALAQRGGHTPFSGTLTASEVRARSIAWPRRSARDMVAKGSVFKRGSWSLRGDVVEREGKVEIGLDEVPLVPLSALTDDRIGLSIRRGALTDASRIVLTPEAFDSENALTLHDLQVDGEGGEDSFAQTFGMPLSVTLALLKDTSGDISLSLPFASKRGRGRAGLTTAFAGVVREAIVGAATSPLKLVGSVLLGDGKVDGFALDPVDFAPASAALPTDADTQLGALAELVGGRPGLALQPRPVIARSDARALKERVLLAALEEGSLPGESAEEASWLDRRRLRSYLEGKRDNEAPDLDAEDLVLLDRALAALPEPRDELTVLIGDRVDAIGAALRERHGLAAEQLVEPKMPELSKRKDGLPRVEFTLIAAAD